MNIIWTIALKDIVDVIRSRIVLSLILLSSLILLLPKMLPLFFEQPVTMLPVYDPGESTLIATLGSDPGLSIKKVSSFAELSNDLCNAVFPELGLVVPEEVVLSGGQLELEGYLCWGKRRAGPGLETRIQAQLSALLGQPVKLHTAGNYVYPPSDTSLYLGLNTINIVLTLFMMGIFLVPHVIFEEKQTKTLDALLVSPASISQVVVGKALTGFFYILVTAGVVFTINWAEVVHWGVAFLFVLAGGLFSVAVGLVLGTFFKGQQETAGWMTGLVLIFVGAVFTSAIHLDLPAFIDTIVSWIPSVALADMCRAVFSEDVKLALMARSLGIIVGLSLPLYGLVIWKIGRSDR